MKEKVLLVDLPVFPKGTISLSLFVISGALQPHFDIDYIDLNFPDSRKNFEKLNFGQYKFIGLKVSAQNFLIATDVTKKIKSANPEIKIVWGGELPSLLPDICTSIADSVVSGIFEPVATRFLTDLKTDRLQKQYIGKNIPEAGIQSPDFSMLKNADRYNSFMGLPLETTRGCTENCTFCMVLIMQQKHYHLKSIEQLKNEIPAYANQFINIVDYNFGVSEKHVMDVAGVIEHSDATGWMAEMNLELLDNDEMLAAMKKSRCRIVYCGLESVNEDALGSVNKSVTNKVANYERIIRKVQSYGINIAAGIILGLDGETAASYRATLDFFSRMGIIYAKFTFLTFNPGTRVKTYMEKKGSYVTEDIEIYDGNRITYLPSGITEKELYEITRSSIKHFYSFGAILRRAMNGPSGMLNKTEFVLFNICFSQSYRMWLKWDIFGRPGNFKDLLQTGYRKPLSLLVAEGLLKVVRHLRK